MGIIDGRALMLALAATLAAQCAYQSARRSRPARVVRVVAHAASPAARPVLKLAPPPKAVPAAAPAGALSNVSEIVFRCETCGQQVHTTDLAVLGVWLCGKCRPVALARRSRVWR